MGECEGGGGGVLSVRWNMVRCTVVDRKGRNEETVVVEESCAVDAVVR